MPFGLLKYGLSSEYPVDVDLPPPKELKPSYDVVIIGGGGHGLRQYLPFSQLFLSTVRRHARPVSEVVPSQRPRAVNRAVLGVSAIML